MFAKVYLYVFSSLRQAFKEVPFNVVISSIPTSIVCYQSPIAIIQSAKYLRKEALLRQPCYKLAVFILYLTTIQIAY